MEEHRGLWVSLYIVLALLVLAACGGFAYAARHHPKFALIAGSVVVMGLGLLSTRMGDDGKKDRRDVHYPGRLPVRLWSFGIGGSGFVMRRPEPVVSASRSRASLR